MKLTVRTLGWELRVKGFMCQECRECRTFVASVSFSVVFSFSHGHYAYKTVPPKKPKRGNNYIQRKINGKQSYHPVVDLRLWRLSNQENVRTGPRFSAPTKTKGSF